jgi:hypothetical protein
VKEPFDEGRSLPPCDPAACGCAEFDYEEVYRRLDGEPQPAACPKALLAFGLLFQRLMPPGKFERRCVAGVGLRMIALAWVLNPAYLPGSPSLTQLARRCGVTKNYMASLTGEMSRLAKWRNRAQQHAWNWAKPDEMGVPDEV